MSHEQEEFSCEEPPAPSRWALGAIVMYHAGMENLKTLHFKDLNSRLTEKKIKQKYFFNFLTPQSFNDYFAYLKDGRLMEDKYRSELDILLLKEDESWREFLRVKTLWYL